MKNDSGNDYKELIKIWKKVSGGKVKTDDEAKKLATKIKKWIQDGRPKP